MRSFRQRYDALKLEQGVSYYVKSEDSAIPMNLFQHLFGFIPRLINLLTQVLLRVGGLLGGLVMSILLIIYMQAFNWSIPIAWYWLLLVGLLAGTILPRYFFFFSAAPWLFSESGYEQYGNGEPSDKEKAARQNGCLVGIGTGLYSLACGAVLIGCLSWLFSEDGPSTLIFRITLVVQLVYAGIVPFLMTHFKSELSPA